MFTGSCISHIVHLQVLKDEKKRAAYDQYGSAAQQPGFDPNAFAHARAGFADFQDFSGGFSQGGSDLFEQLFGAFGGRQSRGPETYRGANLETTIKITFMEACKGATKKVNIHPVTDCSSCSGSGLKPGAKRTTCTACGGSGTRTFVIESGFQMASTCNACHGVGSSVPRNGQCSNCGGVGKVRSTKSVQVDIPAGKCMLSYISTILILHQRRRGWDDGPYTERWRRADFWEGFQWGPSGEGQRSTLKIFCTSRVKSLP
jgi:molecular chaperone DnaJ